MKNSVEDFGTFNNKTVKKYTLENDNGTRISVLDFAGIWQEYSVLDSKGKRHNLLIEPIDLEHYTDNGFMINRIIGRTSGRVEGGILNIDSAQVQLPTNEGTTNLHGGENGLHNQFYDVVMHENSITLSHLQTEETDGFPGDLDFHATYTLFEDNTVTLTFEATQLKKNGVFNPTSHTYWNLSDDQSDILNHKIQINAKKRFQLEDNLVPSGDFVELAGNGFDFANATKFGDQLDILAKDNIPGIDDAYFIEKSSTDEPIAVLTDIESNRSVTIKSDRNGLIMFTGSPMDETLVFTSGKGKPSKAVALEAQNLPNPDKFPQFGDDTIKEGQTKTYTISFKYE